MPGNAFNRRGRRVRGEVTRKRKTVALFPVLSAFSASSAVNAVLVVARGRHHRPSRLHVPQQGRFGREVIERDLVYVPRQSEFLQRPDAVPVHVDFIPGQAMTRGNRMRMMIVVPTFAKGQDGDQSVVGGEVFGRKAPR